MDHLVSTLTSWIHQFGKNYAILMIGNSSSGKSTLSIRLSSMLGVKIVSSDLIRSSLSLTGDPTDQSVNQFAWEMVHRQIESTLSSEQRVIVDVTNALSSDRQAMVENLRV